MRKILSIALKSTAAYIIAQILTGIEGGFIAAYFVLYQGMTIPEALAITIPGMYPIMFIQLVIVYYLVARFCDDKKRSPSEGTSLETSDSSPRIPDN